MAKNKLLIAARQEAKDASKYAKQLKKTAQKIAKEQIKEMRPFMKRLKGIDLRKEISAANRGFINKAWKEYTELTTRPFKVYRSKDKNRLKIAQTFSRHEKGKPKFDVAFVPSADPKAKLIFKDNKVLIKSKYVTEEILFFYLVKLAVDPRQEIKSAISRNTKAKEFIILAGKYHFNGPIARSLIDKKVIELMSQYMPGGQMYEKRGPNSHFSNWLFGLVAHTSSNQVKIDEYRRAFKIASNDAKARKKSIRYQQRKKFGKKF